MRGVASAIQGPPTLRRAGVACLLGVAAAAYVALFYQRQSALAVSDFDAIWTAADALRRGHDPYGAVPSPPWPWKLQYPLPAVLVALPFSYLPLRLARGAFMGVSTALLAFGLTRRAWWPLILLAGGQMFVALQSVQWTPLFAAGVLLGPLRVLWAVKPTTGFPLFAAYPDRRAVIGGAVLLAAAFLVRPGWLGPWLAAAHEAPHRAAIFRVGGFLLLLGLLRWRLPEGRQLAALAAVPLGPYLYEALPLMLVARNRRELLVLAACGTLGLVASAALPPAVGPDHGPARWAVLLLAGYLPALVLTLRRPKAPLSRPAPLEPLPAGARDPGLASRAAPA